MQPSYEVVKPIVLNAAQFSCVNGPSISNSLNSIAVFAVPQQSNIYKNNIICIKLYISLRVRVASTQDPEIFSSKLYRQKLGL